MAKFDTIDAAGNGYRTIWEERGYLLKLALAPILIKFTCHIIIIALGWENLYFRQTLLMLPAYFAEGWMLAHLVRLIFLGQRWPFRPTGDETKDMTALEDRAYGIIGGTLTFVVITFLISGIMAFLFEFKLDELEAPSPETEATPALYIIGLGMIAATVWGFRFIFLYIPTALGYPLKKFVRELGTASTSIPMIGTWIISYMPLFFVFIMIASSIMEPYDGDLGNAPSTLKFLSGGLNIITDTIVTLITTASISYGLKSIMTSKTGPTQNG